MASRRLPKVEPTMLDRVIGYVSPERAARRMQARVGMALFESVAGGWHGGSRSRRAMSEWNPLGNDADSDDLPDLPELRARSRDAIRNVPIARGAINTKVTSIVGSGLKLQSTIDRDVLGLSEEQAAEWERTAEREWSLWSESVNCDAMRSMCFADLQDLAFRSCLANGDAFALLPSVERQRWPYRLTVQLVEADRVCNRDYKTNTRTMVDGIEKDDLGAPIAVHIARTHPGSRLYVRASEWDRVPFFGESTGRRNVLHLIRRERIDQTRGVPDLAPVLEPLKQLGRYSDAELAAAVVSSLFTVFVKTPTGEGLGQMAPTTETGAKSTDDDVKMASGAMIDLAPGEDVMFADPKRPNTAFDGFVQAVLRQIGVALELPFEVLVKHFTASYSAARAALLEAWRFYMVRRRWLARSFCQPVYEEFLREAVALGRITAPGFLRDPMVRRAYAGAMWTGDGRGQINEQAETGAAIDRIDAGLSTLAEETAQLNGGDWERNTRQRAKEVRLRSTLIGPSAPMLSGPAPDPSQDDGPDQPDQR